MPKQRKQRQARVCAWVFSKRDLVRMVESVERLSSLVNDLTIAVSEMKRKRAPRPVRKPTGGDPRCDPNGQVATLSDIYNHG